MKTHPTHTIKPVATGNWYFLYFEKNKKIFWLHLFINSQPFDWRIIQDMRFENFGNVFGANAAIPNAFGIHDDRRAELAGVEAARLISADLAAQAALLDLLFQGFANDVGTLSGAAAFRIVRVAQVFADENVIFESHSNMTYFNREKFLTYGNVRLFTAVSKN